MTYLFLHPIMHLLLFLYTFAIVSLLYKFTRFFIHFLFLSDEGPMLEMLDHNIRRQYADHFIFRFLSLLCLRSTLRLFKKVDGTTNVKNVSHLRSM